MIDVLITLPTVIGFAVFAFYVRRRMDNRPKIRNWPLGDVPYRDAVAISLGFAGSRSATAIILALACSRRGCTRY